MKARRVAILVAVIATLSFMMLATVNARIFPSLPSEEVTLQLTLGSTKWPGNVTFTGITGSPYDVVNSQPYPAWCADFYAGITTAPDSYATILNSSVGLGSTYNKVNYLLNNNTDKDMDVQVAMWLLLGTNTSDITASYPDQPSSTAKALYNNANVSGASFTPNPGQILAVICTIPEYQTLIIELTVEEGTEVIPDFPSIMILPLVMVLSTVATVLAKREKKIKF
jgi:hypothetical protein